MFGFLYELLGSQHEELPHGRGAPITADSSGEKEPRRMGDFVVDHGDQVINPDPWPLRGEVPGQSVNGTLEAEGQTVAEELRTLAQTPHKPPTAP